MHALRADATAADEDVAPELRPRHQDLRGFTDRFQPPQASRVSIPQAAQKPCRRRQSNSDLAVPAMAASGPGSSADWAWNWEHLRHMILPAATMSVIPMGIIARTVRALVAEILDQEFIVGLRAKGLTHFGVFRHMVKNAAPTALAVMGLQLVYLLGCSILIETVLSWTGTGFLLNSAIFQRDLPLLQGTILVLAMFFVVLNLVVDVIQTLLDPRIARGHAA